MPLSQYQQEITKYHAKAAKTAENGGKPYLPAGKADVFRVFCKRGACGNIPILHRLRKNHGIETFIRKDRRSNFTKVCKWIVANVDLHTGSFSLRGTQGQIAEIIGVNQSTVSRILELLVRMELIEHAFANKVDPVKSVVGDKQGIPLNNVYVVKPEFGMLAGTTVGNKFFKAMRNAEAKADEETQSTLKERLLNVRTVLWEGTIERRVKQITDGCLRKTMKALTDRERAARILYNRLFKYGVIDHVSEEAMDKHINEKLKYYGFAG